jgi:MFS family permease
VSSLKNDATGYYDVAAPDTKGAALYIFYRHSLNESCIRGIDTTPPRPADTAYSTNDTTTVYTDVSWVDNAGTLSKGIYIATQKDFKDSTKWYSDAKVNLGPIGPSYSPTVYSSTQCSEIVKQMNFWAPKYADWLVTGTSNKPQSAGPTANPQDQNASTATSCAIDGIGWLVCPVMTFMGKVVDATYGLVSALLAVPPLNTNPTNTDPSNSIYSAWSAMRTIANVAFVIAFLIIIFSQLTGVGIDNYGIKKLLPRIIIAAILVNLSYFICAIAVDLSNILGSSLKSFFDGIQANIVSAPSFGSTGLTGWAGLTQGVITGGAVVALVGVFGGFSLLFPALIAAVLTIVVVFLTLTIRQALIIILIVISPIAFVAFLLPNTMNLFKQWQKLLTTLLLMFPIIAAIFGGSALASVVIMNSSSSFPVQIMGALVAIVPLALTPIIMKSSGSLLGSIGSKIQGYSKKPSEALNKAAAGVRSREQAAKNTAAMNRTFSARGALLRRSARLGAIGKARDDELARQKSNYVVAETGNKDSSLLRSMTRGSSKEARELAQSRAMAAAVSAADKAEDEQVSNAATLIRSQTTAVNRIDSTKAKFDAAAKSGDKIKARAAMSVLLSSGAPGIKAVHEVVSTINEPALSDNSEQAKRVNSTISSLRSDINSAGLKGKDNVLSAYGYSAEEVKNPVTGAMEKTGRGLSINEIANSVKTYSKLNATELAGQDEDVLKGAKDLKDANGVRAITGAQARDALTNPNARQNLNAIKISYLEEISRADP